MKPYLLIPTTWNKADAGIALSSDNVLELYRALFFQCICLRAHSLAITCRSEKECIAIWRTERFPKPLAKTTELHSSHLDQFIGITLQLAKMPVNPCAYPPERGPITGKIEVHYDQRAYYFSFSIRHYPQLERTLHYSLSRSDILHYPLVSKIFKSMGSDQIAKALKVPGSRRA